MMASRVLSRLLPVADGDVSVLEGMRNTTYRQSDVESHPGRPTEDLFHDEEEFPDRMFFEGANDDDAFDPGQCPQQPPSSQDSPTLDRIRPKWLEDQRNRRIEEDEDVPASLLLDPNDKPVTNRPGTRGEGNIKATIEPKWRAAQEQHGLLAAPSSRPGTNRGRRSRAPTI